MKPSEQIVTFIESSISAAKPRDGKRTEYRVRDTRRMIMAGLVLEVLPPVRPDMKPSRSWRVHYDARQDGKRVRRKVKIGEGCTSLDVVHKNWRRIRDVIDAGRDYVAEDGEQRRQDEIAAKRRISFAEFIERYLDEHARPNKRTWRQDEYRLRKYVLPEIGSVELEAVQKQDVRRIIRTIADKAPAQADRVRQAISSVYAFAIKQDVVAVNPASGIELYQTDEKQREPVPAEAMSSLWPLLAAEDVPLVRRRAYLIARIAFLTGLRISEIIGAQKDELTELDTLKPIWKLKETRMGRKRKKPHSVPLTPQLQALFRQALEQSGHPTQVFFPTLDEGEGYRKVWYHVVDVTYPLVGIPAGISLHSIRHFATTQMAFMGVEREWRDRVTDHVGPHSRGEDKRYNHYDFYDQKLRALSLLDSRVRQLAEEETGSVLPLRTSGRQ
jgi:integrase